MQVVFSAEEYQTLQSLAGIKGKSTPEVLRDGFRIQVKLQALKDTPEAVFHQNPTTRLLITLLEP